MWSRRHTQLNALLSYHVVSSADWTRARGEADPDLEIFFKCQVGSVVLMPAGSSGHFNAALLNGPTRRTRPPPAGDLSAPTPVGPGEGRCGVLLLPGWPPGQSRLAMSERPWKLDASGRCPRFGGGGWGGCNQKTFWVNCPKRSQEKGAGIFKFPIACMINFPFQ